MIERRHETGAQTSRALYSPCEGYRYRLDRRWGSGGALCFVMLNPSTATEAANDPTIERCQRRAARMGFGALSIVNLFAWRETSPANLRRAPEPVGPETDRVILETAREAELVVAGWGVHGAHLGRDAAVRALLAGLPLTHLGLTKHGQPRHPLYVAYATEPMQWEAA